MKTVEADHAEANFGTILRDVASGETIVITRHGVPVAELVPARDVRTSAAEAIRDWQRYRKERNLTLGEEVTIRELIEEGRR